jgi:hypothetical protein
MFMIRETNKTYRGFTPNAVSTFYRKKYQKLTPGKSPGVTLPRFSVRFFNSDEMSSDTKNLFTLAPRRSTEISLMGQYEKQRQNDSGQAGMTGCVLVFLLSALSWALHMNKLTLACSLTVTLTTTANKSPCPLVRKGVKGDLGGAGDRMALWK